MSPEHVQSMLWIASTRYYLGRQTGDVGEFCAYLIGAWPKLDEDTRGVIRRSVESAFERDDRYRQGWHNASGDADDKRPFAAPLGMDIDRREWERVRQLWRPASQPAQPTQETQPTTMEATP